MAVLGGPLATLAGPPRSMAAAVWLTLHDQPTAVARNERFACGAVAGIAACGAACDRTRVPGGAPYRAALCRREQDARRPRRRDASVSAHPRADRCAGADEHAPCHVPCHAPLVQRGGGSAGPAGAQSHGAHSRAELPVYRRARPVAREHRWSTTSLGGGRHCDEALSSRCACCEPRELGNSRAPPPARGSPPQREALA